MAPEPAALFRLLQHPPEPLANAEATRAMDRATSERALTHRLLHDDANRRERPGAIAFDPGPAAQATLPSLPPPAATRQLAAA